MKIDFKDLKYYVTTGEMTDSYKAWRDSDSKNLELERRAIDYYSDSGDINFTFDDVQIGLRDLEERRDIVAIMDSQKRKRRNRSILRLSLSASVACALIFITFIIFSDNVNRDKEETIVALLDDNTISVDKSDEVTITTSEGKVFQPLTKMKEIDLRADKIEDKLEYINSDNKASYTEMNTIRVPRGETFQVTLSDGTKVYINNLSTFEYPTTFDAGKTRRVKIKGEAYFEVAKSKTQQFIVSANDVDIKVYGTKFNVNTQNNDMVYALLVEGSISAKPKNGEEEMLREGELLSYNIESGDISVKEVDTSSYTSWVEGVYQFNQWRLEDIANAISLWYNVKFVFRDSDAKDLKYICNFPREYTISEVLEVLSEGDNIWYSIDGDIVNIWSSLD